MPAVAALQFLGEFSLALEWSTAAENQGELSSCAAMIRHFARFRLGLVEHTGPRTRLFS